MRRFDSALNREVDPLRRAARSRSPTREARPAAPAFRCARTWRSVSMRARSIWKSSRARPVRFRPLATRRLIGLICCAAAQHFVVQVRAGGAARGADIADHLALAHARAGAHAARKARHVRVRRLIAVGVADADVVAERAGAARAHDRAVARRQDRRAGRRGEVGAAMHARIAEDRVAAHAEARRKTRAVDRRLHQEAPRALAFGVVPIGTRGRRAPGTNRIARGRGASPGRRTAGRPCAPCCLRRRRSARTPVRTRRRAARRAGSRRRTRTHRRARAISRSVAPCVKRARIKARLHRRGDARDLERQRHQHFARGKAARRGAVGGDRGAGLGAERDAGELGSPSRRERRG